MNEEEYDFSGYATRSNIPCADGRTILPDAFKDCDGSQVPLVWQHNHDGIENVLGHALLESRDGDIYCHCSFNDTKNGEIGKKVVKHGDVVALSIYANRLKQRGRDVVHGIIREVSLVLAGANPGAYIDNLSFAHGDGSFSPLEDEVIIQFIPEYEGDVEHSETSIDLFDEALEQLDDEHKKAVFAMIGSAALMGGEAEHSDEDGEVTGEPETEEVVEHADGESVGDVLAALSEDEQKIVGEVIHAAVDGVDLSKESAEAYMKFDDKVKTAVNALVATGLDGDEVEHSEQEGEETMKFNVFDAETGEETTLSHDDISAIFSEAQRNGSLKDAVADHALAHGIQNIEILFPEVHAVNNTPYPIMRRMEWVNTVISGTRKTPFARIKSTAANFTMDEARARGYIKGKKKIEEQFTALKRVTTPTTIYKLQKLDRDDIIDITDFDVVAWMKDEMRTMLDEETARAVLIGDGRSASDESKINPLNIRPIWTDEDVYAIHSVLGVEGMTVQQKAQAFVDQVIRAKKEYKGSGTPTLFISPELLVELRLLRDGDGYRRYKTDQELADDLRVSKIVEVELFSNLTREVDGVERELGAIILNMNDYTVGATKGGEVTLFDDFDLNYNKYEYLIETRLCGALTMPYSAIVVEFVGNAEDVPSYTLANTVPDSAKNPKTAGFYYFDGTEYKAATEAEYDQSKIYYDKKVGGVTGVTGSTGATGATGSGN